MCGLEGVLEAYGSGCRGGTRHARCVDPDDARNIVCIPRHKPATGYVVEHVVSAIDRRIGRQGAEMARDPALELLVPSPAIRIRLVTGGDREAPKQLGQGDTVWFGGSRPSPGRSDGGLAAAEQLDQGVEPCPRNSCLKSVRRVSPRR